jgi:hypothetical protein
VHCGVVLPVYTRVKLRIDLKIQPNWRTLKTA